MLNALQSLFGWFGNRLSPHNVEDQNASEIQSQPAPPRPTQDEYVKNADESIAHFYDAAKWILGVFAAVAVLLLAGTQLSNIGRLPVGGTLNDHRFDVALASVLVGIFSTGVVILSTVRVLQSGRASIQQIKEEEHYDEVGKRHFWQRTPADLKVVRQLSTLSQYPVSSRVRSWDNAYNEMVDKYRHFPKPRTPQEQAQIAQLRSNLAEFELSRLRVLAIVKAEQVRRTFRHSLVLMFVFGLTASIAIVGFAWAANPPAISASAILFPSRATLTLTAAEQEVLSARIGPTCVGGTIEVIVLDQSSNQYDVVTVPAQGCEVARFMAGAGGIGTLQPQP